MFLGDELTEILEGIACGKPVGAKRKQNMDAINGKEIPARTLLPAEIIERETVRSMV